jgi:F-type H+-transporting ATPase subunit a
MYLPFLMTLFFLILTLNFIGQVPFFGNPNVTGNLTFTLALAVVTFFVVNLSGKKAYWQHTLWMPGVPVFVKPILTIVEFMGLILKPIVLTLRLAANLTAGHIMIVIFVSLLFIFNNAGQNMLGSVPGLLLSAPLTMFMMALEIIVSLVQAFVFTILTASYIGAAIEEAH